MWRAVWSRRAGVRGCPATSLIRRLPARTACGPLATMACTSASTVASSVIGFDHLVQQAQMMSLCRIEALGGDEVAACRALPDGTQHIGADGGGVRPSLTSDRLKPTAGVPTAMSQAATRPTPPP
jgi:hypothetical protein